MILTWITGTKATAPAKSEVTKTYITTTALLRIPWLMGAKLPTEKCLRWRETRLPQFKLVAKLPRASHECIHGRPDEQTIARNERKEIRITKCLTRQQTTSPNQLCIRNNGTLVHVNTSGMTENYFYIRVFWRQMYEHNRHSVPTNYSMDVKMAMASWPRWRDYES